MKRWLRPRASARVQAYPVHVSAPGPSRGKQALLSYIADALLFKDDHPRLITHSNYWECREIARLLLGLGCDVDAINWDDSSFQLAKQYDVVLDIDANLQRFVPFMPDSAIRILHLTGSYGPFQHRAELDRVAEFEARTGKYYSPKRLVRWLELAERSLHCAHACSLLGNEYTLKTYPEKYRDKITLIPVTGSHLTRVKMTTEMAPKKREFLWYFGAGAVHKGLDLVLEVFSKHPEWMLHLVGNAPHEPDFYMAYKDYMSRPNVKVHGHVIPGSVKFRDICRDVFCFIAPSCSEATSTSVVTCMQMGLYPIVSYQTGVDLPLTCGSYLERLDVETIEGAVFAVRDLSDEEIVRQVTCCQSYALNFHSRPAFTEAYSHFLATILGKHGAPVGRS